MARGLLRQVGRGRRREGGPDAALVPNPHPFLVRVQAVIEAARNPGPARRLAEVGTMVGEILKHAELDQRLDKLATKPERFAKAAAKLAREFDAKGIELEIADPSSWRKGPL